jgi:hypothetical protein
MPVKFIEIRQILESGSWAEVVYQFPGGVAQAILEAVS